MPPKTDPYATKLHTRINVILLVFTVVVIALLLRTSAHGQTTRIRSEWEQDDWWAKRGSVFTSGFQLALQPRAPNSPDFSINTGQSPPSPPPAGVTYYYNGSGALNATSSWFTNRNGTGSNPTNFTSGDGFVIQNGQAPTLGGLWTISGTGSGLLVETGGSMTTGSNNPTLTLSMQSGATYVMNTSTYGNLSTGTIDANSTFNHQSTTGGTFRTTLSYGNLLWNYTGGSDTPGDVAISGTLTNNTGGSRELRVATGSTSRTWNIGADIVNNASSVWILDNGSATATVNIGGGLSNSGSIVKSGTGAATINFNGSGSSTVTWGTNTNTFSINIGSATSTKTISMSDSLNNGTGNVGVFGTLNLGNGGKLNGTGVITVNNGGTLALTGNTGTDRLNTAATMTLNGGTLNTGGLSEGTTGTVGTGALTLQSNSIIDLGSGASIFHYANSSGASWTSAVTLRIDNWSGSATGGGTDQLIFGTNSGGLTAAQIAEIQFLDPAGFAAGTYSSQILSNGEIVPLTPVPEPSTWAAGLLALAAVAYSQRRRFSKKLRS